MDLQSCSSAIGQLTNLCLAGDLSGARALVSIKGRRAFAEEAIDHIFWSAVAARRIDIASWIQGEFEQPSRFRRGVSDPDRLSRLCNALTSVFDLRDFDPAAAEDVDAAYWIAGFLDASAEDIVESNAVYDLAQLLYPYRGVQWVFKTFPDARFENQQWRAQSPAGMKLLSSILRDLVEDDSIPRAALDSCCRSIRGRLLSDFLKTLPTAGTAASDTAFAASDTAFAASDTTIAASDTTIAASDTAFAASDTAFDSAPNICFSSTGARACQDMTQAEMTRLSELVGRALQILGISAQWAGFVVNLFEVFTRKAFDSIRK